MKDELGTCYVDMCMIKCRKINFDPSIRNQNNYIQMIFMKRNLYFLDDKYYRINLKYHRLLESHKHYMLFEWQNYQKLL